MSTKAIREVLEWAKDVDNGDGPPIYAALREVEAIEKASRALGGIRQAWHGDAWFARGQELVDLDKAADVLERIAAQAPVEKVAPPPEPA